MKGCDEDEVGAGQTMHIILNLREELDWKEGQIYNDYDCKKCYIK